MFKKRKKWWIAGGAVIAILLFLLLRSGNKNGAEVFVNVEEAQKKTITTEIKAKGEVKLKNTKDVYTETKAAVSEVLVETNDKVAKGDVLIRYSKKDRDKLNDELKNAKISLKSAQISLKEATSPIKGSSKHQLEMELKNAENNLKNLKSEYDIKKNSFETEKINLDLAKNNYENQKALYDGDLISKMEFESEEIKYNKAKIAFEQLNMELNNYEPRIRIAEENLQMSQNLYNETIQRENTNEYKNRVEKLRLEVQRAQLNVDSLQKRLNEFQIEILSPIDGTIVKKNVTVGEVTMTEKVLFEVANLDDYIVKVNVKERSAPFIKLDQEVIVTGDATGKQKLKGVITKIDPVAINIAQGSSTEKVVPIEITMDASAPLLKAGYTMEATIETHRAENAIVVPIISVITEKGNQHYVYIVNEESKIEKRNVEVGVFSDLLVEVRNVKEGELVITDSVQDMQEGQVVKYLQKSDTTVESTQK